MSDRRRVPQSSDLQNRRNVLKENIDRINSIFFKRTSYPKVLTSARGDESPNVSMRIQRNQAYSMQFSRIESPQNHLLNNSRDPPLIQTQPINKFEKGKPRRDSPQSPIVNKIQIKKSKTIAETSFAPDSPMVLKKDEQKQQSSKRIELKLISRSQRALTPFKDNSKDLNSQRLLTNRKEMKRIRSERNLRGYSIGSLASLLKTGPTKSIDIIEKKSLDGSSEDQSPAQFQNQLGFLLKEAKFDFSRDRKNIKQMINEHRKDMDQISKKHFKPSFKLRWAVNVLGKPPEVDYSKLYSCSRPGFKFYKKKFMNSDQEV